MAVVLVFSGAARSMGYTAYMSLGYSDVPETQMRDANVLAATVQQLSAGLAIAVGAVALHVGGKLTTATFTHPSSVSAFTAAFFLLAAIALGTCAMALLLPRDAGSSVVRPTSAPVDEDAESSALPATSS